MNVRIILRKEDLQSLICNALKEKLHGKFDMKNVRIEVKSKQNYKSEWEDADFQAIYETVEM
jgi:hypothetical protein